MVIYVKKIYKKMAQQVNLKAHKEGDMEPVYVKSLD